ncbi:hypothetical protein ACL655_08145 [Klebsiella quasipneumoniae subsp. similipneumoniae]
MNWRIFPGGFHVLYIPDPLDDARLMMKALASGHGKAAINAVMIYFPFTGQCHPSKPALADNLREWHEKFQTNTTLVVWIAFTAKLQQ